MKRNICPDTTQEATAAKRAPSETLEAFGRALNEYYNRIIADGQKVEAALNEYYNRIIADGQKVEAALNEYYNRIIADGQKVEAALNEYYNRMAARVHEVVAAIDIAAWAQEVDAMEATRSVEYDDAQDSLILVRIAPGGASGA